MDHTKKLKCIPYFSCLGALCHSLLAQHPQKFVASVKGMKRNAVGFAFSALLLVLYLPAEAQQPTKVYRIGYLSMRSGASEKSRIPVFLQQLQKLGYTEGKNIVFELRRVPLEQREKLRELAAELVRLKADVIVGSSGDAARIAKDATTTIPIVFTVSADPVGEGLVQSLARPGANVTGLSDLHGEMLGKRLELLKEVVPSASVIAFLWNSNSTAGRLQLKEIQAPGVH